MRKLTFQGFLEAYAKALAGVDTRSLSFLANAALAQPRVTEPLLLWAAESSHGEAVAGLLEARPDLTVELATLVSLREQGQLEYALATEDPRLRTEYLKVWKSYVARRDAAKRDADLKLEVRDQVLALAAQKHVTRYRMAKDLGFNPGNLHAFLSQGVPSKISLDRAFELLDYLKAA